MKTKLRSIVPYMVILAIFVYSVYTIGEFYSVDSELFAMAITFIPLILNILLIITGLIYGLKYGYNPLFVIVMGFVFLPLVLILKVSTFGEFIFFMTFFIKWLVCLLIGNIIGHAIKNYRLNVRVNG